VSDGRIWYFAYGSNMQAATFRGRRGIEPLRALAARLPGWRLVLDKPPLVPVGEGLQLFTTLQRLGIPSKMINFPDEGHWVLKPQNSQFWYKTFLDWLATYLK